MIKPNLNKEYSSLCSSQTPVTDFLFGDDLQSRLASIKASNKVGQTTTSKLVHHAQNTPGRRPFDNTKGRATGK